MKAKPARGVTLSLTTLELVRSSTKLKLIRRLRGRAPALSTVHLHSGTRGLQKLRRSQDELEPRDRHFYFSYPGFPSQGKISRLAGTIKGADWCHRSDVQQD